MIDSQMISYLVGAGPRKETTDEGQQSSAGSIRSIQVRESGKEHSDKRRQAGYYKQAESDRFPHAFLLDKVFAVDLSRSGSR